MRIGIDARMYGPRVGGGGLGRYVEQLVKELQEIDQTNRYVLFLKKENFEDCRITNGNFKKVEADIHWYTLKEQMDMGGIVDAAGCDLMHFPHWNVPVRMKTPFVVTIHDLILLEEPRSAKATTRHPAVYAIKYRLFKYVLGHALTHSLKIIAVSNYTKQSILKHFPNCPEKKIEVIFEGVTDLWNSITPSLHNSITPSLHHSITPSLLYIGNAYPHKNLETLLHAFAILLKAYPAARLTLAGRNDLFSQRLRESAQKLQSVWPQLTFVSDPTDAQLAKLYAQARVCVFPSRMEGFALPALEAMRAGVPVAASDISTFREILKDAAVYFSPHDAQQMAQTLGALLADEALRLRLTQKGFSLAKTYSWKRMAQSIKHLYGRI